MPGDVKFEFAFPSRSRLPALPRDNSSRLPQLCSGVKEKIAYADNTDKTIDVVSETIYHRRAWGILTEGLRSTTHPDVELHYGPESGTPSTPPN